MTPSNRFRRLLLLTAATAPFPVATAILAQADSVPRGTAKPPGGIVAIVGDEVFTQAELDKEVERRRAQLSQRLPAAALEREHQRLEWFTLQAMINDRLILQLVRKEEKKETGPCITEQDVDAEIGSRVELLKKKGVNIKDVEDIYQDARRAEGLTREEFRRRIKERLSINRYLWQKVFHTSDEFVSPRELKAYYQSHREEFSTPVAVSFRMIKIPPTRDNTMDVLLGLVEKGLKDGEDFVELSRKVLDALGGDLEMAGHVFVKSFEDLETWPAPTSEILRGLKKGQVSERVVTVRGDVCFFKVEDLKEGEPRPFAEVQEEITKRIRAAENQASYEAFVERQKRKTRVDVFLLEPKQGNPIGPAAPSG
ncbi:MAG: peptidyl-prolyl cis-trans isomerase [Planctomycetes bacterium]|nr:peptidyl-prolyl cis-trans isomerase [Planctomycetota bacterium]